MPTTHAFAAQILETSAAGFAAAADALFRTRHAQAGEADAPSGSIRSHLLQRILELAAAVRLEDARLFTQRVDWLRRAYQARGADETTLRLTIESLRDALLEELPGDLRGPVAATLDPAIAAFSHQCNPGLRIIAADTDHGRLALEYLRLCLEGKPAAAVRSLVEAAGNGMPVERLLIDVLAPVQQEAGELWHSGELSVAEEHVVSEATREALSLLVAAVAPAADDARLVLAAAVSGNAHDIGLRIVSSLFRLAGWESIFLGANVPAQEVAGAAHAFKADVVLLNATLTTQLKQLQQTIDAIRSVTRHPAILIGGKALDENGELWSKFGADGFARDATQALALAESFPGR